MTQLELAMLWALLAGATIPLGGFLARIESIRPQWLEQELRHSVIAFGGGVLLAAVSLVLVPQGISYLSPGVSALAFFGGGLLFFWLDRLIEQRGAGAAQLIAMVSDFVPEAMAMGALFASGESSAVLLAVLIGMQNLPEGFNAYREQRAAANRSPAAILWTFAGLAMLGPVAAVLGHVYLTDNPAMLGVVMLVAAAGILYLTFQDIAVQAHLERAWAPSLGAVAGFLFGLIGHMLIG